MPSQSGGDWLYPSQYSVTNQYSTINKYALSGKPDRGQNRPSTPCTPASQTNGRNFANDITRAYTVIPQNQWKPRTPAARKKEGAQHDAASTHRSSNGRTHDCRVRHSQHARPQTAPSRSGYQQTRSRPVRPRTANNHAVAEQLAMVEAAMRDRGIRPQSAAPAGHSAYLTKDERRRMPKKSGSTAVAQRTGVYVQPGAGEKGHLCTRAKTGISFCDSGTTQAHRVGTMNATHNSAAAGRPPSRCANGRKGRAMRN